MRLAIYLVFVLCSVLSFACVYETAATNSEMLSGSPNDQTPPVKQPVLIELFTSEGCSSCPPADRALTLLEKQQPVNTADAITLEFHVDYWDGPAWRDPFSSALFTQRQQEYETALKVGSDYTPQMIVDGRNEFVGSNLGEATRAIEKSLTAQKGNIDAERNNGSIKINVTALPSHEPATVFVAAAEDDLRSNVTGGENSGEKLAHTSVVRELKAVGMIEKGAASANVEAVLPIQSAWKKENVRYVVFVQENASRKIIAVNRVSN